MKVRKTLLVAALGWAGLATQAGAQIPAPPVAAPLGTPVAATAAPPTTIWQKLGLGQDQKAACKAKLCASPCGQLINNATMPLTLLSGGLIPPFCPLTPSAAQLADAGAQGAAAAIQADEAGAKARRAAVRYLGTVDCHYWPEAGDALIAALRGDRNECVRWEAAMALSRGCCCTKKTIEALSIVVSCSDRDGAPKETSHRVHVAAGAALDHCLACYAKVTAAPAPVEKPTERSSPPPETIPPPQSPPVPAPVADAGSAAKSINPGEAKPALGSTAVTPPAAAKRPVGPEYYARIAKAPLADILAEARRVAEKLHATPMIATTPFDSQGHSIASLMSYATGPDTQEVIPIGTTVPAGEVRAELVSAKPANLWDMLSKPSDQGQVVIGKTETLVVQSPPKPVVVKREVAVAPNAPTVSDAWEKRLAIPDTSAKRRETSDIGSDVATKPEPVAKKATPTPAPTPVPMPKPEPLTLDFPPPAPMEAAPASPSPYYATAATPVTVNRPYESATSAVSAYHPTAATPKQDSLPVITNNPTPSPYNMAIAAPAKPAPVPFVKAVPVVAPAPLPAPAAMPARPMSTKPMPAPAAPVVPATMVAPAAPVVAPAVAEGQSSKAEIIQHLIKTAKGDGPVEVRRTSIRELAKIKASTPEVMVALDGLSDDPAPAVRGEAIIAAARLRMGQ